MLSLLMISMAWGQGSEDFENHSLSGTNYVNGSSCQDHLSMTLPLSIKTVVQH